MKKLALLVACAIAFAACDNLERKNKQLQEQNDSLQTALTQSNVELEQFMGTFSEIQEGFRLITEAEGRINAQREGVISSVDQVKADMEFIAQKMKSNREQIAQLQQKLKNSNNASAQLKKTLEQLTAQLVEKSQQIEALQADLAARNIRIATLDETIAGLRADSLSKERTLNAQDKALNTAWFVYGTKKELKEQKILQGGDVLQNDDFNKDYFTQIDIRKDTEFKLYSKSAKLLTTHPEGSYILTKDSKGQYILRITDPTRFWSVSRYLVIQVRV